MKQFPTLPVVVVDDETPTLDLCEMALRSHGLDNIQIFQDSRDVLDFVDRHSASTLLLDLTMPHMGGEHILSILAQNHPEIPVIIITGTNDVATAVDCIKKGAFEYLVKPLDESRVATAVRRAVKLQELQSLNDRLQSRFLNRELERPEAFADTVTQNEDMLTVLRYVEAIASTAQPVLVQGETGVGKELVARAIHRLSRPDHPMVPVNVAGLDDNLFSDTLFGHVKGAFTSAESSRPGLIEKAAGGTFFLDEIGDLSPISQVKLLRLIQEREYAPLGSSMTKRTDARIIVATHCNLEERIRQGLFRKDLYYRLQTHRVRIPPLRERLDDLPLLVDHFLDQAAYALDRKRPTPPPQLLDLLATYHFPGNVRELEATVFDAVSRHKSGVLSLDTFRDHMQFGDTDTNHLPGAPARDDNIFAPFERLPTLRNATEELIQEALKRANGNQTIAARLLGMTRAALNKRITRAARKPSDA